MGERNDSEREIRQSRERLSTIAEELARRAQPAYLKEQAKSVAHEMKAEAKTAAREKFYETKEAAVKRSIEIKDRARVSPMALGSIGAVAGALIGRALAARNARHTYAYGYDEVDIEIAPVASVDAVGSYSADTVGTSNFGTSDMSGAYVGSESYGSTGVYASTEGSVGGDFEASEDKGSGIKERVKSKAGELGSKASDVGSNVRGKVADMKSSVAMKAGDMKSSVAMKAGDVKSRAQGAMWNARSKAGELRTSVRDRLPSKFELREKGRENPMMVGVGAIILGGLAALLVPVTMRERQVMAPKKREAIDMAKAKVDEVKAKVEEVKQGAQAAVEGFKEGVGLKSDEGQQQSSEWSGGGSVIAGSGSVGAGWSASDNMAGGSSTTGASYGASTGSEFSQSQDFGSAGEFSGSQNLGTVSAGAGYEVQSPIASPTVETKSEDESKKNQQSGLEDDLHSIH